VNVNGGNVMLRSCNVMIHARNYSTADLNTNIVHGNDTVV
jgi:hypothetical protein